MLTIIFYSTNGPAAKQRSREIVAQGKGHYARVYDVGVWHGSADHCEAVEIMPDVPGWQRNRITAVYGEVQEKLIEDEAGDVVEIQTAEPETIVPTAPAIPRVAKHRGGGRWFVMQGEEIISGPHDKAEAQRLVAEES